MQDIFYSYGKNRQLHDAEKILKIKREKIEYETEKDESKKKIRKERRY